MTGKYNNEGDEVDNSHQPSSPEERIATECHHTMTAINPKGRAYCCDCGRVLRGPRIAALKPEDQG